MCNSYLNLGSCYGKVKSDALTQMVTIAARLIASVLGTLKQKNLSIKIIAFLYGAPKLLEKVVDILHIFVAAQPLLILLCPFYS